MTARVDVLVASPDAALRGQVALALGGERFDVDEAADTEEAVQRVAARPPAVLVADLELAGKGALALADTLRSQPETREVRTLLVTVPGHEGVDAAPGIDGVLATPFTSLALLRRVEGLLEA